MTIFREEATSALAGFHGNWNLEMLVFVAVENRRTRRKTLGARREQTTHSTHICHRAGIEPAVPHWWKASALAAAPSPLPCPITTRKDNKLIVRTWLRQPLRNQKF